MMLPILISVSVAPVSYFFCANALSAVEVKAMTVVANAASRKFGLESTLLLLGFLTFLESSEQMLGNQRDLPCAVRHQEDDEKQNDAEHGAGETLGDSLRDVRNEDDKSGTDDRARQPSHAADDHAEKQRDRKRDGVGVRRDELHGDRAKAAGHAGDAGADAEGQRLVERNVDAHRGGRDLVVADRHEGAPGTRLQKIDGKDID